MNSLIAEETEKNITKFQGTISKEEFEQAQSAFIDCLSKYSLLYEIPFIYLVPEQKMLKEESLRFFELDPYWIWSLLDGACSIGRNTAYDYSHDEVMIQTAYQCAMKHNAIIRKELAPDRTHRKEVQETDSIYTGFLLHSRMVSDYNGLEVTGEDKEGKQLPLVRLEHLSDRVMLGLFGGRLHRVNIAQPEESLHLGIGSSCLRDISTGKRCQEKKMEIVPDENRRLSMEKIAQDMKEVLKAENITSAELALELIQNAYTAIYTGNIKEVEPYEVSGHIR